jgi:hypothetical protein
MTLREVASLYHGFRPQMQMQRGSLTWRQPESSRHTSQRGAVRSKIDLTGAHWLWRCFDEVDAVGELVLVRSEHFHFRLFLLF